MVQDTLLHSNSLVNQEPVATLASHVGRMDKNTLISKVFTGASRNLGCFPVSMRAKSPAFVNTWQHADTTVVERILHPVCSILQHIRLRM